MKNTLILAFIVFTASFSVAQDTNGNHNVNIEDFILSGTQLDHTADSLKVQEVSAPGDALYLEIGGPAVLSANYELSFKSRHRLRLGLGWNDMNIDIGNGDQEAVPYLLVHALYAYLFGRGPNYFELGGGLTYALIDFQNMEIPGDLKEGPLFYGAVLGYRRQMAERFLFRAGITAGFSQQGDFLPIPGLSFGYSW